MRTVRYSSEKLMIGTVAAIAGTALGYVALGGNGKVYVAGLLLVVICPVLLIATIKTLMGDLEALSWDERRLTLSTLWRRRVLNWHDISWVGTTVVTSRAFFGLIKTGQSESLTIKTGNGLLGSSRYALSRAFLDLTDGQYRALLADLAAAHDGYGPMGAGQVTPATCSVPQSAPAEDYGALDTGFDPDAVLARYMAKKQLAAVDAASAEPAPRPSLNGRALPSAMTAVRPASVGFGRKGL